MKENGVEPIRIRNQIVLDITKSEVQKYIIDSISFVIEDCNVDYIKWDCNRGLTEIKNSGSYFYDYVISLYKILDVLTRKYPQVLFEGCASGGNRFDLGILYYMPQIWASDNTDAKERLFIQEGLLIGYPQSCISAHVPSRQNMHTFKIYSTFARFAVSAMAVLGYELDLTTLSEKELTEIKEYNAFYKKYRKTIQYGDVYQTEKVKDGGRSVISIVDKDKNNAVVLISNMDGVKAKYPNCIFLSEWVCPPASVGKCGFDFDYIGHDCAPYNELFRNEPKTNLFSDLEKGNNYFSPNGKGSIKPFIDYANGIFPKIEGKGYFSAPTGCHDEIRIATGIKDDEVLKTAFAFLFTFKNIPFIYYGDEIGLKHNFCVSKDGGGIRTGARTPMQWNENKNRGFSSADITYLPTNNDASCSVASQLQDEFSVLNTVKKLSAIRKEYSFLNADADIEFIEYDYPLIFRRKDKNGSAVIIINPSNRVFERTFNVQKTLLSNNVSVIGNNIKIKEKSFIIFEEYVAVLYNGVL